MPVDLGLDRDLVDSLPPAQKAEVMVAYLREKGEVEKARLSAKKEAFQWNTGKVGIVTAGAVAAFLLSLVRGCDVDNNSITTAAAERNQVIALKAFEKGYVKAGDYVKCGPEGAASGEGTK